MTFKNKDIKDALNWEGTIFSMEEEGEWVSEGKYEVHTTILKHEESGKFYEVNDARSGSYFSDYYYDSEDWNPEEEQDLREVQLKEVTVKRWVGVK